MPFRKNNLIKLHKWVQKEVGALRKCSERAAERSYKKGSLTVEAALVIPVFLGVILLLCGLFHTLQVYEELDHCLCMTARQMAACSAGEHPNTADAYRFFYLGAKGSNVRFEHIKGSMAGIRLSVNETEDNLISLHASCRVNIKGYLLPDKGIRIADTVYARRFTGSEYFSSDSHEKEDHKRVTVAENGTVYHRDSSCTYLKLSVKGVSYQALSYLRNAYGQKYTACEKCSNKKRVGGSIYITESGTSWHCSINCSGLSRYFYTMDEEEAIAEGYRACSRCGR